MRYVVRRKLQPSRRLRGHQDEDQRVVRRKNPERPPQVEASEADALPAIELLQQQACDQVSGDDEEDANAELTQRENISDGRRHRKTSSAGEMREKNHRDRDCAQPIE